MISFFINEEYLQSALHYNAVITVKANEKKIVIEISLWNVLLHTETGVCPAFQKFSSLKYIKPAKEAAYFLCALVYVKLVLHPNLMTNYVVSAHEMYASLAKAILDCF